MKSQKNEMRYLQQAVSSAIRVSYKAPKRSIGWQQEHVHDLVAEFVSRLPTGGQFDLRSALESFSQFSRSFECGAFRFFLWWLFLHRRLRSGNEAQLASSSSHPLAGPCLRVPLVFIRVARESLATFSS
jgi:hypothetical protein